MLFGRLDEHAKLGFFYENSELPFEPDESSDGTFGWKWDRVFDSIVETRAHLDKKCFLSAVVVDLLDGCAVESVKVMAEEDGDGYEMGDILGKYTAETGKEVSGRLLIPVGVSLRSFVMKVKGCLKPVTFKMELWGAENDGNPTIWPTPASVKWLDGEAVIGDIRGGNCEIEEAAADFLKQGLEEKGVHLDSKTGADVEFCLDESGAFEGERYTVSIEESEIRLTAGNRLSLLYAADTILKLVKKDGRIPCVKIDDRPYKPMRGFHMFLPPKEELGFAKRFFRHVLIPLHYNQLFVEFAGGMRFDSHPEISEGWLEANAKAAAGKLPPFPHGVGADDGGLAGGKLLEKAEVKDMLDEAHALGLDVIPEVQSLGHVQYITYSHPELAETETEYHVVKDVRGEDARPSEVYAHCYCPSNEAVYPLIHDLIDEIVEVAGPEHFVHMGHDEVYQIGVCPVCRKKKPEDLYLRHVMDLHDYLAVKGLRMVIWSDMLQPTERYLTYPAAKDLPKDILMLDFIWYFHFDLDMEDHILPYGFEVSMGNMYSSHYPRYEERAAKERMMGGEVSTWVHFDEYTLARNGKFWDLMYSAEMLWDPNYREELRNAYVEFLAKELQPEIRRNLRGSGPEGERRGLLYQASGRGFGALAEETDIPVPEDGHASYLHFGQYTDEARPYICWKPLAKIGAYTVSYSDGTTVLIPAEYAGNALALNSHYAKPLPAQYYRHNGYIGTWISDIGYEGKTADGEDLLVLDYTWKNPYPEKEIVSILYRDNEDNRTPLMLSYVEYTE